MSISLRDALTITEDVQRPFAIKFVSLDVSRNIGGELIDIPNAVRVGTSHNRKVNDTIAIKPTDRNLHPTVIHNHLILEVNGQEVFI